MVFDECSDVPVVLRAGTLCSALWPGCRCCSHAPHAPRSATAAASIQFPSRPRAQPTVELEDEQEQQQQLEGGERGDLVTH